MELVRALIICNNASAMFMVLSLKTSYSNKPVGYIRIVCIDPHLPLSFPRCFSLLCTTGCGKSYGKRSHLTAHYRKHTGERPYVCLYPLPTRIGKTLLDRIFGGTVCGQRFSRSDQLTRHRRKHENYKPFECPVCHRSFFRADHRQAHLRTHRIPNASAKQSTPRVTSTLTNPSITSCAVPYEDRTISSSYSSSSVHRTALCFPLISTVCSEPWIYSGFPDVPPCSVHLADETQSSYFSL
ncbi:hypothetical protein PHET_00038 [Paragonimus heterotremus]|uniref:C2H2-type domain-containing protein n=1 Tax=Paragonimus heterotremus TaxID=100268 RepID=A0A8J4TK82_9TREM|nr:hypothetical protein PHET_00038 [Paragonimus heterotremus]